MALRDRRIDMDQAYFRTPREPSGRTAPGGFFPVIRFARGLPSFAWERRRAAMRVWRLALSFPMLSAILGLAAAAFLAQPAAAQGNAEPKRVVMLHSFGLRFKPWTDYAEMLRPEMFRQSKAPHESKDQALLNARRHGAKTAGPM